MTSGRIHTPPAVVAGPRWILSALAAILIAAAIAFSPALRAPFQFDDIASIPGNPTINSAWPPPTAFSPPNGITVSGRPVVNYSLALNHALDAAVGIDHSSAASSQDATTSFHVVNLALHLICGLILFGIIRRTVRAHDGASTSSTRADIIALLVAGAWLLHPIQTEAVDYVIQRTELLVSLFLATTLYASIRAWDARTRRGRLAWYALGVVACLLGMGSKEVMIGAPIVVILYDRAFRLPAWRDLLADNDMRRWFYIALLATEAWLFSLIASGARMDTVGLSLGLTWQQYFYSQMWAIGHYVRLLAWPAGFSYDYGQQPVRGAAGIVGLVGLTASGILTLVAWSRPRWRWFAFVGSAFFILLAPSSSFVPIRTEIAAERRIYLASACFILLVVLGAEQLWKNRPRGQGRQQAARSMALVAGAIMLLLAVLTFRRSALYGDPEALWRDATVVTPSNARAWENLAAVILKKDAARMHESEGLLEHAIAVDSTYATSWTNLADIELQQNRVDSATNLLEHVLRINPALVDASARLGGVLVKKGEPARAIPLLERVVQSFPTDESLVMLGEAYAGVGRRDEAFAALRRASDINPRRGDVAGAVGAELLEQGHPDQAIAFLERAAGSAGDSGFGSAYLSLAFAELGRGDESVAAASAAVAKTAPDLRSFMALGRAMFILQRTADAERFFGAAVKLAPADPEALTRLGLAEAAAGRKDSATTLFNRALLARPGYQPALNALKAPH